MTYWRDTAGYQEHAARVEAQKRRDPGTGAAVTEGVARLLGGLGSTPQQVAESLVRRGITGGSGTSFGCPIARVLTEAGVTDVSVRGTGSARAVELGDFALPTPVTQFVAWFDGVDWARGLVDEGLRGQLEEEGS